VGFKTHGFRRFKTISYKLQLAVINNPIDISRTRYIVCTLDAETAQSQLFFISY
jgi:hypothetical protein